MQAETGGWTSILGEIGPWVLSSVALVQVWAIALWKRLRKGAVEIHGSGPIEIGHSNFGPTVGVRGTLEALHRSVFVESIYVEAVRLKDGARHTLGWRAIRPNTLKLAGNPIDEIELPSSFLLRTEEPYRFNILFNDSEFVADLGPVVNPLPALWWQFRDKRVAQIAEEHGTRVDSLLSSEALMEEIFREFSDEAGEVQAAWKAINEAFYWKAGEYEITMAVACRRPDQEFAMAWRVELSEADSEALRRNAIAILRSACGVSSYLHFAQLEPLPETEALQAG